MESDSGKPEADIRALVGTRLQKARDEAGYTQDRVTALLGDGFSVPSLSRWENGKELPNLEKAARLAALYNVALDWIVGRTECPAMFAAGKLVVDTEAMSVIEEAAKARRRLTDVPLHIVRPPGVNCAWIVPKNAMLMNGQAAADVEKRMQHFMKILRRPR